ncbi:hypothetical protein [Agromyces arachidis]|uniref:hypothetical protein n=1 Tax=Agromyces arachidis TaxID=766966 RepID=UPI004057A607
MATYDVVRRLPFAAVALATVLLLAGCAPGAPVEDFAGLPVVDEDTEAEGEASETEEGGPTDDEAEEGEAEELPDPTGDEPVVQYLNDGGRLAITIWGSSTCPVVPSELRVTAEAGEGNAVEAVLPQPPNRPCTMDFVPHTTIFSTPMDVTTTQPLEVTIGDQVVTVPIK